MSQDVVTVADGASSISSSITGMIAGFVLFFGSFALLWWNEGEVIAAKNALDEMRKSVVKTNPAKPAAAHEGKLVHATGKLGSKEKLGDAPYLKPGPYLKLERKVEMFQWVEEEKTSGSGKNKKRTYTYTKQWAEGREKSEDFHSPDGHANPQLAVAPTEVSVSEASFGKLDGLAVIGHLAAHDALAVTPALAAAAGPKAPEIKSGMLYLKKKRGAAADAVGDVRISYAYVKPGTYSVIARQVGSSLVPHTAKNGKENFLVEAGAKGPQAMIQTAKDQANMLALILRVVGFFLMFIGMNLAASPITAVLSFIPFLGSAGRFVLAVAFFFIAAILTTATIVISMIAHSPILLVGFAIAVAGLVFAAKRKKTETPRQPITMPQAPSGLAKAA